MQTKSSFIEVIKEHKSQLMFFILLVGVMGPTIFLLIKNIMIIRPWMMSGQFKEPSVGWPVLSDMWITVVGALVSWALNAFLNKFTWNFYYRECKEKNDEEARIAKTQKMVDNTFRTIFFTVASVWGYVLGFREEYFPMAIGGRGDFTHMFDNYPSCELPAGFKQYYLGIMGYHVFMLVYHSILEKVRHDYMETMFHHVLVLSLFSTVYFLNYLRFSLVVLVMNDIPDIFIQALRVVVETNYKRLTVFIGYCTLYSWIYFRQITLAYFIYRSLWQAPNIFHGRTDIQATELITVLFTLLLFLNSYWLTLLLKALVRYKRHGEAAINELKETDNLKQKKQ